MASTLGGPTPRALNPESSHLFRELVPLPFLASDRLPLDTAQPPGAGLPMCQPPRDTPSSDMSMALDDLSFALAPAAPARHLLDTPSLHPSLKDRLEGHLSDGGSSRASTPSYLELPLTILISVPSVSTTSNG